MHLFMMHLIMINKSDLSPDLHQHRSFNENRQTLAQ